MLSEKAQELIKKSRIVSFKAWEQIYDVETLAIFQQADDEGRYLTDADLQQLEDKYPHLAKSLSKVVVLRDRANEIINDARSEVLESFPGITEKGGGLYPPVRAEACWRDFWHFLRCTTYGIAGQSGDYTSQEGLGYMEQLYQELRVPLDAMVLGLENLKIYSLRQFSSTEAKQLSPYFDVLVQQMEKFSSN